MPLPTPLFPIVPGIGEVVRVWFLVVITPLGTGTYGPNEMQVIRSYGSNHSACIIEAMDYQEKAVRKMSRQRKYSPIYAECHDDNFWPREYANLPLDGREQGYAGKPWQGMAPTSFGGYIASGRTSYTFSGSITTPYTPAIP